MTEKELKKLNRKQLLQLLLAQTERADRLQKQLDIVESELRNRNLIESEAGSIAEASLKLNGVFEAAQAAAAQYLDNVKRLRGGQDGDSVAETPESADNREAGDMLAKAKKRCGELEAEGIKKAEDMLDAVKKRCAAREAESRKMADAMLAETKRKCGELEAESRKKAVELITEAERRCAVREAESRRRAEELTSETERSCREKVEETDKKLHEVQCLHRYLDDQKKMMDDFFGGLTVK